MEIHGVKIEKPDPSVQRLPTNTNRLPPAFAADQKTFVGLILFLADLIEREPPPHNLPHFADESGDLDRRKPKVAKATQRTDSFPPNQAIQGQAADF